MPYRSVEKVPMTAGYNYTEKKLITHTPETNNSLKNVNDWYSFFILGNKMKTYSLEK